MSETERNSFEDALRRERRLSVDDSQITNVSTQASSPPEKTTLPEATLSQLMPAVKQETVSTRSVIKIIALAAAAFIIMALLWKVRQPLTWLIIATILAVSMSGPVNLLTRWMPRPLSITLAYLLLVLLPIGMAFLLVPPLIDQIGNISDSLPSSGQELDRQISSVSYLRDIDQSVNLSSAIENVVDSLPINGDAAWLSGVGLEVASLIFSILVIIALSIFLVARGHEWIHTALEWLPSHTPRDKIERALENIAAAVSGYVNGALLQAVLCGGLSYLVLEALGIPFAGGLAVIVGLFNLVPIIGSLISTIIVALATVPYGFPLTTIIWVVFSIGYQQIENNIIQPRIQERVTSLNAFFVLLAVLFGAALMGIVGALLAIPVAASIKIALTEWLRYRAEIHASEEGKVLEES